MIRRSTWILLVILALLVGFAFIFQRNQDKKAEITATAIPTDQRAVLFGVEGSQVSGIDITNSSGSLLKLFMDPLTATWAIRDVPLEQADTLQINANVEQLLASQIIETLTQPPPLDSIGLAAPVYTITVTTTDGFAVVAHVGALTPVGSGYYTRVGSGPVVIVEKTGIDNAIEMLSNPPLLPTPTQATPTQTAASGITPLPEVISETATPVP